MTPEEKLLVERQIKKYYFDHFDLLRTPPDAARREFGYQTLDGGMIRHITLKDDNALRLLVAENTPSDIYCSRATYLFPELPMKDKVWQGADLIFDIDAQDLNLECRRNHTYLLCGECGRASAPDTACKHCDSKKHKIKSVTCDECIAAAKSETAKLVSILRDDLGISSDIKTYFSGNEGFHLHIEESAFREFDSRELGEICDYLSLKSALPETFGVQRSGTKKADLPSRDDDGWRGRIAAYLYGKTKGDTKASRIAAAGYDSFLATLESAASEVGARIDRNTTTDVHRIFRLPGSINSKSGLSKIYCKTIESFDPYTDACLLDKEPADILADSPVPFHLKGEVFGPYNKERVTVPGYAAAYMICKGLASIA